MLQYSDIVTERPDNPLQIFSTLWYLRHTNCKQKYEDGRYGQLLIPWRIIGCLRKQNFPIIKIQMFQFQKYYSLHCLALQQSAVSGSHQHY